VATFGFGRNHIRLTQVAHALDINDAFVVATMPGTVWEKEDFEYIQANKYKLREAHTGIYGSDAYNQMGRSIDSLVKHRPVTCTSNIIKMRRLLPDQASWRLLGESKTAAGKTLVRAYFADNNNIIRGFAIPMEPDKNLLVNLSSQQQWGGFYNLETIVLSDGNLPAHSGEKTLTLYAYSDSEICQGEKIELPDYKDLRKKSARPE
jgi:hypothetical protein